MKKQSFITILLTMLMSMTGAKALAYDFEAKNEDGVTIYYRYINDGTELEVVYKSILVRYGGDIVIPEEVTYMGRTRKVTSIGSETFSRSNVRSVIIPNSVTSIGDHAFQHCLGLQSLSIPDNVTFIGEGAFSGCQNISTMIIPNGVTSIKANTFSGCSRLSYVLIPQSVTTIEHHAFSKCISLLTGSIPEGVTSIGNGAFSGCVNLGSVVIPSSVTSIGQKAFDQVDLMDVYSEINDPFEISPNTFNINTLNNGTLNVPKGTKDKYRATPGWNNFKYIEDGTEDPGDNEDASYKCGQDAYYIYDDATSTLTIYGSGAMNNYYIDDYAPWYSYANEIKNIEISPYITTIGDFAFYKCSNITNITLPFALTSIGSSGFEECSSLTSLTLNEGVESINGSAFEGCTGLKEITLPSTVKTILLNAFKNCTGLTDMYCYAESVPNTDDSAFDGMPTEKATLHVPGNAVEAYRDAWPWSDFKEVIDINGTPTSGTCGNNVNYSYDKTTYTLTISGSGAMDNYEPGGNDTPWDSFADEIKAVIIESGVTSIGSYAFWNCSGMTSVTIPETITIIGDEAFSWCENLSSVIIPQNVTNIGREAFSGCVGLLTAEFHCKTIDSWFAGLNLKEIIIGDEVTSVGEYAFYECSELSKINTPANVAYVGAEAMIGTPWYNNHPDGVVYLGKVAYSYKGTMPENTEIKLLDGTLGISGSAFYECSNLSSIIIPKTVTSIGESAFYECESLTSVTIPNSVKSIGNYAFFFCSSLKTVISEIEEPFEIESDVFYTEYSFNHELKAKLIVPKGTKAAYQATAGWDQFQDIVEAGDEIIDDSPISGTCGENVSYSYDKATHTLTISGEGEMTFYYDRERPWYSYAKEIEKVVIEDGVTSVGAWAFIRCSALSSVDIAESVKTIYNETFRECTNLTSIDIPEGLKEIGSSVFDGCTSLTSVNIPNSVISIGGLAFHDTPWLNSQEDGLVYINNVLYMYKGEMPDNTNITIDEGTVFISGNAFQNCNGLTSISIPGSVTTIGGEAFSGCKGLTSVKISEGVTAIWYDAFEYCTNLTSVTIPSTVTSIGNHAFQDCKGLTSVNISEGVTSIGEYTFMGCSGLTSFVIPNSVTSVGSCAIAKCSGLTSVIIGKNVTTFGDDVFYESTGITSVISLVEKPFELSNSLGYTFSPKTLSEGTLFVPAGTKALYQATAGWDQFQNIVETDDDDPMPMGLLTSKDWRGVKDDALPWIQFADPANGSAKGGADGIEINVAKKGNLWEPQAMVCDGFNLKAGGNYRVVVVAKLESNGIIQIQMGDWDQYFYYRFPVKAKGDFQEIVCDFPNYSYNVEDAHVLFQCGDILGTTIVKSVKVIDLDAQGDDTTFIDGVHYKFDAESLTAEVLPTSQNYEGNIVIPATVMNDGKDYTITKIGDNAFKDCKNLTSVTIPNTLETIGMNAFEGCTNLRVIKIGNGVKEIGDRAFASISGNSGTRAEGKGIDVYCYAEAVPKTAADAFDGTPTEASTLHVPASAVEAYKAAWPWSDFKEIVAIEEGPDGVMSVRQSAEGNGDYYDLTGRKAQQLRKGLYIRNGKKIVIK